MVLHSRGCGRVARRRFKRIGPPGRALGSREALFLCSLFGLPGGRRSGNPIFYIPPVFFTFRPNPMRVPGRPFLFIPLFFFPLVSLTWIPARGGGVIRVPDAGEWCCSGGHPGLLRAADSPRRPWIPWSRTLRIAVPCLLSTEPVSFGYRCDVWWCLPGTGWCLFRCRLGLCRRLRRR